MYMFTYFCITVMAKDLQTYSLYPEYNMLSCSEEVIFLVLSLDRKYFYSKWQLFLSAV